ncbi:hypothetical protein QTJ16_005906 [Diplocarpon rosae]|uniref:FAD-binding domain-containing protein n=1 Tax=Diplocarpon rosae TaxID=946125 RepID=A0AAD9SU96_9HELO|nr:hypothetical protein QTJ16_005906 [Diplocarpon rosae]
MSTQWKALIGVAPIHTNTSDMTVIHNNRYSFLTLSQPGRVFFFVFFRLAKPRYWPEREYYSDLQAEELAATVASHPISESLAFGELWKKRSRGALISVEEGVLDHWHYGRIVLAGDSAHKVTPNIALGGNSGMESIVVLSNHLRHMMIQQQGSKPSLATLQRVFSAYQSERHLRVKEIMEFSSLITKVQAWDTPFHKFLANWVLPLQPDRAIADQLGQIIRGAPKLDFVSTRGFSAGSMGWNDESLETHKVEVDVRKTGTGQVMKTISAAVVTLLMLLGTAAYVFPILSVIS